MGALTLNKKTIQEILDKFPEEIVLDDFIEQVIITAKLDQTCEQFKSGEFLNEKELEEEIKK